MPARPQLLRAIVRASVVLGATSLARARMWRHRAAPGATPRVLVVRPDHVGDLLLSTPALDALRAGLPAAHITAMVGPWAAEVLAHHPALDSVEVFDFPGFARTRSISALRAYQLLPELARHVRRGRYDMAINLRPDFWWGASVLALAGVPVRVGFALAPGSRALTHREPWPAAPEHTVHLALRLVQRALRARGAPMAHPSVWDARGAPLSFPIAPEDHQWAADWLARRAISPTTPPLVLHPGAGAPIKLWTAAHWAQSIALVARATAAPVLIAGQPAEACLVSEVASLIPPDIQVVTCNEPLALARYGALISRAQLALGVDSGPMHLAVAVGTPSVRLYGPTDPRIYGPWGESALHAALASSLPCAPCGRLDYPAASLSLHPCVRLLRPEDVADAARRVLAHAARRPFEARRAQAAVRYGV